MGHELTERDAGDAIAFHRRLVDRLKARGHLADPRLEAAYRAVPRHLFLPGVPLAEVYRDRHVVTKSEDGVHLSSSTMPSLMAGMLTQLGLAPGQRVLEIGAGTGYNAALLAHLVGEDGEVVTLDIDEDTAAGARRNLEALGCRRVRVICRDGAAGHPEGAPWDRILVTVRAALVAPAWRRQLAAGGRLVMPLAIRRSIFAQVAVAFEDDGGVLTSRSVRPSSFMNLRGILAREGERTIPLGPEPGLSLVVGRDGPVDTDAVYRLLTGPYADRTTGFQVTLPEVGAGLQLWMTLRDPDTCGVVARGGLAEGGPVPLLMGTPGELRMSGGLFDGTSLCLLRWADRPPASGRSGELVIRSFGDSRPLVQRLGDQIGAWDRAGRPAAEDLLIRIVAPGEDPCLSLSKDAYVLDEPWGRLVVDWRAPINAGARATGL